MTLTITLPEKIAEQLQRKAKERHLSVVEVAMDILQAALDEDSNFHPSTENREVLGGETDDDKEDSFPSPEKVVAKFMALPPEQENVRPAQGSLAAALRNKPYNPDFDFDEWNRQWAAVEAEIKSITRANAIAEGQSQ